MKEKNQVMTANRLGDGAVVYLAPDDNWVLGLDEADVAKTAEKAADLEERAAKAAKAQKVVSTYLFAVDISGDGIAPISQREIIRAAGPTVGTDLPETTPLA